MNQPNAVVAIYSSHTLAEKAVKELEKCGFDMKSLSIIGAAYHTDEHVVGYYNIGERMIAWGTTGAFWGGMWGLLFGSGLFFIPGVGPLFIAGPLVGWVVAALEGAIVAGGLSAIGAGLYSQGIPKDSILQYETALKAGEFVVIVNGTPEAIYRAKEILLLTQPQSIEHHQLELKMKNQKTQLLEV